MELVIDSNCLISALIRSGKSREIILSPWITLYAPEHILSETFSHKKEILRKSEISENEFDIIFSILLHNINIVPKEEFKNFIDAAIGLAKHPEDAPFLALALAKLLPIWSDDKALKKQQEIKVLTTSELITHLRI